MNNKENVRQLVDQLNTYCDEYYNQNAPSISDAEYDELYQSLQAMENETGIIYPDSPTQTVGYNVVSNLLKTQHEIPLLSLDSTQEPEKLYNFIKGRRGMLMLKLDGLTTELDYENGELIEASTRGDGYTGDIVTHNAVTIKGIPTHIPYDSSFKIAGETFIKIDDFEQVNEAVVAGGEEPYSNPRNLAAGSLRCLDSNKVGERKLSFIPFRILKGMNEFPESADSKDEMLKKLEEFGFDSCSRYIIDETTTLEDIKRLIEQLRNEAVAGKIPIDGIVATFDSISYSNELGTGRKNYNDGYAFKFKDEQYETILKEIQWETVRNGDIVPTALYEPVDTGDSVIKSATLSNVSIIKELELHPGCRIRVSKRNMIIPHIEENLDRGKGSPMLPACCPSCGSAAKIHFGKKNKDGRVTEILACENTECPARHLRKYIHFISKTALDIKGLDKGILSKLLGHGLLHSFPELFSLDTKKDEIIAMDRFGEKSYNRIWREIQQKRHTTFERFLISLDIPMIGDHASKKLKIIFHCDLDEFYQAVQDGYDFTTIEGFGEILNNNIHNWFKKQKNIDLWKELKEIMTIKEDTIKQNHDNMNSQFEGCTIVATGELENFTRMEINMKIECLGAKAGRSVSKKTSYVIAGKSAGSKLAKAKELGITIISEQEFIEMIGEN